MIFYLVAISLISFTLFGIDKWKAKKHQHRISEFVLLFASLLGGSVASVIAMFIFNHKISKPSFWLKMLIIIILQILLIVNSSSNYK